MISWEAFSLDVFLTWNLIYKSLKVIIEQERWCSLEKNKGKNLSYNHCLLKCVRFEPRLIQVVLWVHFQSDAEWTSGRNSSNRSEYCHELISFLIQLRLYYSTSIRSPACHLKHIRNMSQDTCTPLPPCLTKLESRNDECLSGLKTSPWPFPPYTVYLICNGNWWPSLYSIYPTTKVIKGHVPHTSWSLWL